MRTRLLASVALLWAAGPAWAERTLTYDEVLRLAVENNPQLVQVEALRAQAEADVTANLGRFDPVLGLQGGWNLTQRTDVRQEFSTLFITRSEGWNADLSLSAFAPTGTTATLSAGLARGVFRQDFEAFGNPDLDPSQLFSREAVRTWVPVVRLSLGQELLRGVLTSFNLQNVRSARSRLTVADLETEQARQQALADVAGAYWNWVYTERLAEIARRSVAVAEENLRVGAARVDEGRAAPVERTRLEAALVQSRSSAIEADHAAAQAADALLLLLGERPGQAVSPGTGIGAVPALQLDLERVVQVALDQSVELRIARERADEARRALRDARHALLPSLRATIDGQYSGSRPDSVSDDLAWGDVILPGVTVGGVLSVPLGNRAAIGAVRRAEAEVSRQESALQALADQVRASVEQQVRVLEAAAKKVELADANLRLARETLAAEEALHEVGRTLLKDVLESRTQVEQAEGEAMRARTEFRRAEVELLRLQGKLGG